MLIQGNAMAIPLRDNSVQTVVTSPPYWGLRNYQVEGQLGLEKTPEEYVANMVQVFREVHRVLRDDGICWLNLGDSYVANGSNQVPQTKDHKGSGYAGPNRDGMTGLAPKNLVGIPWRIAFALQAAGWYLRSDIIWAKPNPMPESVTDRPTKSHEYIFLLAKSGKTTLWRHGRKKTWVSVKPKPHYARVRAKDRIRWFNLWRGFDYFFDQDAVAEPQIESERQRRMAEQQRGLRTQYNLRRDQPHGQPAPGQNGCARSVEARQRLAEIGTRNIRSVWTVATQPYSEAHFATFPEALIKPCILAGAPVGGIVLDPFSGSGTTVKVAQDLGRVGIGLELKGEYLGMAQRRTAQQGLMLG